MITERFRGEASLLWITLFTLASVATSLLFACATPFTALAALAATQMRRRDGVLLMLASWAASQAVGVCVHHYPVNANMIGWAVALGAAAVTATLVAREASARIGGGDVARIGAAYLVATVAFKAVILLGAVALAGGWSAFAPAVLVRELVRNGAILIGLLVLYRALLTAGLPAPARAALA